MQVAFFGLGEASLEPRFAWASLGASHWRCANPDVLVWRVVLVGLCALAGCSPYNARNRGAQSHDALCIAACVRTSL